MLGDSTMQFNDCTTYPQTGWGQVAGLFFSRKVAIFNYAKNGRSTKSFIDEKRLAEVEPLLRKGDYVIIQFGHNDEKEDEARRTEPFSTYKENLAQFVSVAKKAGAYPILLSSISRRSFDERGKIKDTHGDYPRAMKAFAQDNGLPFVDMNALTTDFLNNLGETKSRDLFMNFDSGIYDNYPEGKTDNTHLRYQGAFEIARIALTEIKKLSGNYEPLAKEILL